MKSIEKDWTIMVYMAGDNNLSIDMAYALNDIKNFADIDNSNVNFLVYFDGNAQDVPTLYCDFTDRHNPQYVPASSVERRFNYQPDRRNDDSISPRDSRPRNENSAAMYSVMNFAEWCVNKVEHGPADDIQKGRKAKNYAMIFSGHGFGFQSITLLKDNASDYYMTIYKLRAALERINQEVIGDEEPKLAILGFDSCVMGMLEVGFELKDVAKVMIASQGTIPNAGWTYEPILNEITKVKNPSDKDIFDVSKGIVRSFIKTQEHFAIGGVSVDLTAWDLSKIQPVVEEVNKLGEILLRGLKDTLIKRQLELILLKCHYKCQSFMFEQNVDLIDFCENLIEESDLFADDMKFHLVGDDKEKKEALFVKTLVYSCQEVILATKDCVLINGFSGGSFQYAKGISIFLPWTYYVFLLSERTYNYLRFVYFKKGEYWRDFLSHYLGDVSLRGRSDQIGSVITLVESKTTENPKTRTTENPKTRTTENPKTRLVEDATGVSIGTRTTENPKTRTTENPKTRMLDAFGPFLYGFKNVASPWFVAGLNEREQYPKRPDETKKQK